MAKTGKKDDNKDLRRLVAQIMTNNVNVTKDEYKAILKQVGIPEEEIDKCTDEERTARIKANYYGTMLNMNMAIYNQLNNLAEENACLRAITSAICNALGIDVKEIKTSADLLNEEATKLIRKQNVIQKARK